MASAFDANHECKKLHAAFEKQFSQFALSSAVLEGRFFLNARGEVFRNKRILGVFTAGIVMQLSELLSFFCPYYEEK